MNTLAPAALALAIVLALMPPSTSISIHLSAVSSNALVSAIFGSIVEI